MTIADVTGRNDTIYGLEVLADTKAFEVMFNQTLLRINEQGGQEGHIVATANDSEIDGGVVAHFNWTRQMEGDLRAAYSNVANCACSCTLF